MLSLPAHRLSFSTDELHARSFSVRHRATLIAAAAAVLVVGLAGCGNSGDTAGASPGNSARAGPKLKVVATTTQVADFARNIGGDRIELTQLLKPNVDPHDYEASPA